MENIGDLSGKNFSLIKIPDSNGRPHETTIYGLTALGRVGGLVASNNRLKNELFANRNYRTIKAVARLNHLKDKDINWRRLKAYCINNDLEIKEVDDEKFGTVKSYPIEAFKTVYPELITE